MLGSIREKLAHSSPAVRELVGVGSYLLPAKVRLGAEFFDTIESIQRSHRDPDWARRRQRELLEHVLRKASTTRYYAQQADGVGQPIDVYARLARFPVLTRAAMTQNRDDMLSVARSKVDLVSTSGSSGKPAIFYLDKARGATEWAYVCASWSRAGYSPDSWRAVLRGQRLGSNGKRLLVSRSTRELYLSPYGLDVGAVEGYWDEISKRRIRFLHGYPSSLAAVAKAALQNDAYAHRECIAGIFPVSEPLTHAQTEVLRKAFPGAVILPFYGLSERVAFAEYDINSENYVFASLYGHVEVVDDNGLQVDPGSTGRIVATGLRLTGMPLLRYDTGDIAKLEGYTPTGSPIVSSLQGKRTQEHLYTHSGAAISTSTVNVHSDVYAPIFSFRFVQRTYGRVEVLVVLAPGAKTEDAYSFASELQRNCGDRITFQPSVVPTLPDTVNGKQRLVEMLIPDLLPKDD